MGLQLSGSQRNKVPAQFSVCATPTHAMPQAHLPCPALIDFVKARFIWRLARKWEGARLADLFCALLLTLEVRVGFFNHFSSLCVFGTVEFYSKRRWGWNILCNDSRGGDMRSRSPEIGLSRNTQALH